MQVTQFFLLILHLRVDVVRRLLVGMQKFSWMMRYERTAPANCLALSQPSLWCFGEGR